MVEPHAGYIPSYVALTLAGAVLEESEGMRRYLLVIALVGCAADAQVDIGAQDDPLCTRVEGPDLGEPLTVHVRAIDTVRDITFTSWQPKLDGEGYVGFDLDTSAAYMVKADFNFFYDEGTAWQNPFGEEGALAFAIDYVDICDVYDDSTPTVATPY
jgi:hypothetical protein